MQSTINHMHPDWINQYYCVCLHWVRCAKVNRDFYVSYGNPSNVLFQKDPSYTSLFAFCQKRTYDLVVIFSAQSEKYYNAWCLPKCINWLDWIKYWPSTEYILSLLFSRCLEIIQPYVWRCSLWNMDQTT